MQTVETRLRSEMDAIFNFLGVTRSSVQRPKDVKSSARIPVDHIETLIPESQSCGGDNNNNLRHRRPQGGSLKEEKRRRERIRRAETEPKATTPTDRTTPPSPVRNQETTSPPRPTTLDMSDPRQKLLKSQLLIEKHINKLLKELEDKNSPSARLQSS